MIGQIKFNPYQATMDDDGRWTASTEVLTSLLNLQYPAESGPQHGRFGVKAVYAAAKRFKAEVSGVEKLKIQEDEVIH